MEWNSISLSDKDAPNTIASDGSIHRDHFLQFEDISPLEVYLVLKQKFGPPNSSDFDENKTQWQYSLQTKEAIIHISDWKIFTSSMVVYLKNGSPEDAGKLATSIAQLIKNSSNLIRKDIKRKKQSPQGRVIENAYLIYRSCAESLFKTIQKCISREWEEEWDFYPWAIQLDISKSAFLMYLSSIEAFVNLIYEIYLKDDLREDRIYQNLIRENVDIKIRLAPTYCDCFKSSFFDSEVEPFKRYQSLVNLRNDFVHANFTKPMLKTLIIEDGFEFVEEEGSATKIGIPNNISEINYSHIYLTQSITNEFVDYIISLMKPKTQKEFQKLLFSDLIKLQNAESDAESNSDPEDGD